MEVQELLMTALRAVGVYVFVLVIIRLSGKRTIGNFTAFDLIVALMVGEVVDEIIYGDVTLLQGAVPIIVVALLHEANARLSYWDHGFDALLEGKPCVIIRDGEFQRKGLRAERMNEKDVLAELRLNGIDDVREVRLATVENDGKVSVILHEWAEPVQKSDVDDESRKQRDAATGGGKEPPPEKQTDSPRALDAEG